MKEHRIQVDLAKCIGCGMCRRDCPADNISITDNKAVIKSQVCIKCGHCVAVCPKGAVSMTGFEEPPVEIKKPVILDPQQLMDAIRTRRSIRQFKNKSVAQEVTAQIIEAGRLTPSGENAQDVSYIVLKDNMERFEKMAVRLFKRLLPFARLVNPMAKNKEIDDHFFFHEAPVVIMIVAKDKINGALAASNMALMAEANGLGVLYSGFFTMAANMSLSLRRALGLKRKNKVVETLVLGYPAVTYHRTAQKEAAKIRIL